MSYNVIWIDDEWDTRGISFIRACKLKHQILISAFKKRNDGIAALESDIKHWDAVILDAKAYNNSEIGETPDVDGLYAARDRLIELRSQRYIPFFVFTRQPDLIDDKMFEKSVGKFYKKDYEGEKKLISDLKEEVAKSTKFQTRMLFNDSIEQLEKINMINYEDIIDIFVSIHHPELPFTPKLYFNSLRQGLEYIFRTANKFSVLPNKFFESDKVNLNQCFMYLIGNDAEQIGIRYGRPGEKVVPRHIQDMMSLIVNLGNEGSHSKLAESEIIEAEKKILKDGLNPKNLVYSMALQLCEVARWMNNHISDPSNIENDQSKCVEISDLLCGKVEYQKIYHIGDYCCAKKDDINQKSLLGKEVKVTQYSKNKNPKTKDVYPYFAMDYEVIENGSK